MNAPTDQTGSTTPDRSLGHLTGMVDRRAHLLQIGELRDLGDSERSEFESLTHSIKSDLADDPPTVRRLDIDRDAELLARLAPREPIHPLENPYDRSERLRRVDGGLRCYTLESPAMPDRPLNVVWVALCEDLPSAMEDIIGPGRARVDPANAVAAVFYSIWGVEPGLVGIPGGSKLISDTMAILRTELPQLEILTTISPIPGFREWYEACRHGHSAEDPPSLVSLMRSCVTYLRSTDESGRPIDSVARFHMRNGARMWRLLPDADHSVLGQERSFGLMVNYRYFPEDLDSNAAAFAAGDLVVGKEIESGDLMT